MTFTVAVCTSCGHAVFPPRVLCPACAHDGWREEPAEAGVVEEVTERDVRIAAVRTDRGPRVIARLEGDVTPGDRVRLDLEDGAVVAR